MARLARRPRLLIVLSVCGAAVALAGCYAPLDSPGRTKLIELVSSSTSGGWKFDYYRNKAYPCSISGYQTFVIGTKVGSSDTRTRPLWVRMRGGGVGYFDSNGQPQPSAGNKSEESAATSIGFIQDKGLTGLVRNDPAGFRLVSVSMCDHDIYWGGDQPDPNNPNKTPDGKPRTTNGLFATKAAVEFAAQKYPTSKVLLHGTSAGSAGVSAVAYGLQLQGDPPAGAVADSGVVNYRWEEAQIAQSTCGDQGRTQAALDAIKARLHPVLTKPESSPDKLVARGDLSVPILQVWSRADPNVCGATPMSCPLADGTTKQLGSADCNHELMRAAIESRGAASPSRNMRLCVSPSTSPGSCATHVVTNKELTNTDPGEPSDYNAAIMDWVHDRLADP